MRVQPRASRTELVGRHGDALKIRVAAPPVAGAANEALVRFLAERLGVPPIVGRSDGRRGRTVEDGCGERGRGGGGDETLGPLRPWPGAAERVSFLGSDTFVRGDLRCLRPR